MPRFALAKGQPAHNFAQPTNITVSVVAPPGVNIAQATLVVQTAGGGESEWDKVETSRQGHNVTSILNNGPATVNVDY